MQAFIHCRYLSLEGVCLQLILADFNRDRDIDQYVCSISYVYFHYIDLLNDKRKEMLDF
ncbi:hypothetical protein FHS16_003493 [Paenibacillus endophyticus]|uniref:Uncharacterized protein n=1 Tax=Paenibacillus endophyticus TaxID=1294268 RepID=A0A7W5GB51_9BACL|nr:hypothetical protein [Paenibacillus endophyticus]